MIYSRRIFSVYREFSTRLFSFLRFTIPGHEIRSALWQALIPPGATAVRATVSQSSSSSSSAQATEEAKKKGDSTSGISSGTGGASGVQKKANLNYEQLGRRFELNAGSIRSAIASAVSEAAMRTGDDAVGKFYFI